MPTPEPRKIDPNLDQTIDNRDDVAGEEREELVEKAETEPSSQDSTETSETSD